VNGKGLLVCTLMCMCVCVFTKIIVVCETYLTVITQHDTKMKIEYKCLY